MKDVINHNIRQVRGIRFGQTKRGNKVFCKIANNLVTLISMILLIIVLTININAQTKDSLGILESNEQEPLFSNSFNFCPFSAFFGLYSGNYEHLINQTHGIVLRFDYESISDKYQDNPVELSGYGFILNYRYHLAKAMESIFIGSYIRYRIYDGTGTADDTNFDFKINEWSYGLNVGKRWVWDNGLNVTFALGYGFSNSTRETTPTNESIESTISAFEDEYTFFGPFLGELSIGYAF
jgi:hypothetical protein